MPVRLLVLVCALALVDVSSARAQSTAPGPRPVRDVTEQPRASVIGFVAFDFQTPGLYHAMSVHYRDIEGQPSIGEQYGVRAVMSGQDAIAELTFEIIDQDGAVLEPVPMVAQASGVPGDFDFIGMMTVPARPFRVRVRGVDIYGRTFSKILGRVFRPVVDRPAEDKLPPDLPREFVQQIEQMFADARAALYTLAAGNPTGRIVMPRTRISNVMYAPFVSASGRPLGIRVTYDVEFSVAGRYNPRLRLFAEDREDTSLGRYAFRPFDEAITPLPRETYAPFKEAERIPFLLEPRADFLYEAGTTYRFSLDLVPEFVLTHRHSVVPCLVPDKRGYGREAEEAFARMIAREGPTTYRVFIGGTAFAGRIENFPGEGAFYRGFTAEGTAECEPPPDHTR